MGAVKHREDAERPLLSFSRFGYPYPPSWLRFDRLVVAQTLHHDQTLCWLDRFHAVDARSTFALVILRHLAYREGTGSLGFHQQPLKVVSRFVIPTKGGLIDPLLQSVHAPFQLPPGGAYPVLDWLLRHRFRFFPVTHGSILHPTVPTLAYPLAFPEAFASSAIPPSDSLRLVACSLDRPPERAMRGLLRSDQVFCVPVGPPLSAGSRG